MELYILWHGEAENASQSPDGTDSARRLTPKGRDQAECVCEKARELGAKPSLIFTSPLVRARETAGIAKDVLKSDAEIRVESCLEPEGQVQDVYALLAGLKDSDKVVLVTHFPLLGRLVRDLIDWPSLGKHVTMQVGSLMRVESETHPNSGLGRLAWLLPQCRRSGTSTGSL